MNTNLDFSNAPDFAKTEKASTLIWDGAPLQYRFSGRDGLFYTARSSSSTLQMQILDWRWVEESRFRSPNQHWLDVLFVDVDGMVSILPLKKHGAEAMSAFFKSFSKPDDFDISPHSVLLKLSPTLMECQEYDDYWVPNDFDWHWIDSQRFGDAANWLTHEKPSNPWIVTGEVLRG